MKRLVPTLLATTLSFACASDPPFCEGTTRFDYEPVRGDTLVAFPDDFYSRSDSSSPTGLRPDVTDENAPWLQDLASLAPPLYEALSALDGFGTSAGIVLRFSAPLSPLPSGEASARTDSPVRLVDLGGDTPVLVPFESVPSDDGATWILWPMRPLRPRTAHAVVVTERARDAEGGCISPSTTLRKLLRGEAAGAGLSHLGDRYARAAKALGLAPGEISAATVFTTGSITEASVEVAQDIRRREYAWSTPPACDEAEARPYRTCTGVFTAGNYTADGVYADGSVQSTYELPVALWLPPQGDGPFPLIVFGHGLAGAKEEAYAIARVAAPLGIATVAIDATAHGDHPTSKQGQSTPARVLGFFGISLSPLSLSPFTLRENLRQATWDKLQLVRLLQTHPTVGRAELDTTRMAYVGLSLGGIMASELLALTDAFDAAILVVAGGRIASIVSDSPEFSIFLEAFKTPTTDPSDSDSVPALIQALIDAGDGVNYAPHVLANRLPDSGARPPHLLFGAVMGDQTVVNASNFALARALGTPQLPPVLEPIGLVDALAKAPVAGNMPNGRTAAFFQYDRFSSTSGPEKATHDNVWLSPEVETQARHFLETWLKNDAPEVIDPYATLETPPLR